MTKTTESYIGNRLIGDLPKIGIRAVIDGRRNGVREALEDQTMRMAHAVKELMEKNLLHACGLPVETVISDTTIGGVAEAARCAEQFRRHQVGAVISVTPCWCYAAETIDMDPLTPKAIWGFNGSERPGSVYLAGACAAHDQKGLPAFKIYGRDIQDKEDASIPADVAAQILRFGRAAIALATMRGKSYLSMGGVSMGIAASIVDVDFFQCYLGMRCEYVDMSEFVRRLHDHIYDHAEFEHALAWVKSHCAEMPDPNPPERQRSRSQKDQDWETSVKMALIARDLMVGNPTLEAMGYKEESEGHNAIAAGFQGQRQWTDHFPTGDFMEAILNSPFDWNGMREPYPLATENDSLNAVGMLFGHLLSGRSQIFADVRSYWSPTALERVTGRSPLNFAENGFLYLTNSGAAALDGCGQCRENDQPAMKPFWEINPEEVQSCLKATHWGPAKLATFRGGGFSSSWVSKGGMPFTMLRLNLVKGLGAVLQIIEGHSIDLPADVYQKVVGRTDPTWPHSFFVPEQRAQFRDIYAVMKHWGANHCVLCYGHVGADLITLASMVRIPVAMHNVEQVFRPSSWDAFGTANLEDADFRACQAYGPLYGHY